MSFNTPKFNLTSQQLIITAEYEDGSKNDISQIATYKSSNQNKYQRY